MSAQLPEYGICTMKREVHTAFAVGLRREAGV